MLTKKNLCKWLERWWAGSRLLPLCRCSWLCRHRHGAERTAPHSPRLNSAAAAHHHQQETAPNTHTRGGLPNAVRLADSNYSACSHPPGTRGRVYKGCILHSAGVRPSYVFSDLSYSAIYRNQFGQQSSAGRTAELLPCIKRRAHHLSASAILQHTFNHLEPHTHANWLTPLNKLKIKKHLFCTSRPLFLHLCPTLPQEAAAVIYNNIAFIWLFKLLCQKMDQSETANSWIVNWFQLAMRQIFQKKMH